MNQMMRWRSHCTCGCNPCRCDDWCQDWCDPCAGLSAEQRACLKQLLREVANEGGLFGPIHGVTDGSDATPGDVGEFIQVTQNVPYAGYPTITNTTVSLIVLQPGDWDLNCTLGPSTVVGGAQFYLSPNPTGSANLMFGWMGAITTGTPVEEGVVVIGQPGRLLCSVPTLLPFFVSVDQSEASGLTAGTAKLTITCRRAR